MPYKDPEAKKASDRAYYLKNRAQRMAYIKEWQDKNKERVRSYKQAWQDAHSTHRREYYLTNRERYIERARENYQRRFTEDPERERARQRDTVARRRAKQRASFVERVKPQDVWERDGGICQICGEPANIADWHLDHVIPISRGGEHSYANTQVTHPMCNWRKAAS